MALIKKVFFVFLCLCIFFSCKPDPGPPLDDPEPSSGSVFILNEGNFQWGNASLDLYSPDSEELQSGIFESVNNVPLGDVLQSMSIHDGKAYLVVNNSGKIELIDPDSLISLGTINGLTSPRFFQGISSTKAYVSDLYANSIAILDLQSLSVSGSIPCPGWTEQMVKVGDYVFVTNVRQAYVYVVDTQTDILVDSIAIRKGGIGLSSINMR